MATVQTRPTTRQPDTARSSPDHSQRSDGFRRGAVLLVGALAILLLIVPIGPLPVFYNPLLFGITFLAAAALVGRHSPMWAAGTIVGVWGIAKVIQNSFQFPYAVAFVTIMLGLGAVLAGVLGDRGFKIGLTGIGVPIVGIGIGQFMHMTLNNYFTWAWAAIFAVWGVWEMVSAARGRSEASNTRSSTAASA